MQDVNRLKLVLVDQKKTCKSKKETVELSFETVVFDEGCLICVVCSQVIDSGDVYYLSSINDLVCKECLEEFLEKAKHKTDRISIRTERENYDFMIS